MLHFVFTLMLVSILASCSTFDPQSSIDVQQAPSHTDFAGSNPINLTIVVPGISLSLSIDTLCPPG